MEFMLSFLNIIDLLGILPFYFSLTLNIISSEYSIGRTGDSFTLPAYFMKQPNIKNNCKEQIVARKIIDAGMQVRHTRSLWYPNEKRPMPEQGRKISPILKCYGGVMRCRMPECRCRRHRPRSRGPAMLI
jgi:hypothetical protein